MSRPAIDSQQTVRSKLFRIVWWCHQTIVRIEIALVLMPAVYCLITSQTGRTADITIRLACLVVSGGIIAELRNAAVKRDPATDSKLLLVFGVSFGLPNLALCVLMAPTLYEQYLHILP